MKNLINTNINYKSKQLKLPLEIEKIIEISDPVYNFCEIVDNIDLESYFVVEGNKVTGRPRYSPTKLLKIILFSFMENGYLSVRGIEKSCRTDIRYMWLLEDCDAPSFMTISNFIKKQLTTNIEKIFVDINKVIFEKENVDLSHTYIDGTKIEANANKYSWVWKKSCVKNRDKTFEKLTTLINEINKKDLFNLGIKIETRSEYALEYIEEIIYKYKNAMSIDINTFVNGRGHRKSEIQKRYEELITYYEKLKSYSKSIEICGEKRGSYSKTDESATFMRVKRDYMGNDQLLPAYNIQAAVCDEYIATIDVKQYASDMDCFIPLMEKFKSMYGFYPKYPTADAGYGSYNNYIYCEQRNIEKFMKFTMYEKETKDKKYRENPYRAVNFKIDAEGNITCPNNRKFNFKETRHIPGNQYGRTEELYECEDCTGCPYKEKCCPKAKNNRTIRMNKELTAMHKEVLQNLNSIHGALLCMNRSIQAEGTFGNIKSNRLYKRIRRKGLENVILEIFLIACGFNLYKFDNKKKRQQIVA